MKYVALLRGINVVGNKMIRMEMLREIFTHLGFENVRTYINSGNVVFEVKGVGERKLVQKIHDAIFADFGFDVSVMVRPVGEMEKIIANNPFNGQFENDKDMHVFFLSADLSKENKALLLEKNSESELIDVQGRTVYYMLRISFVDGILAKGFIDKKLKVPVTARNWRTIKKISEM